MAFTDKEQELILFGRENGKTQAEVKEALVNFRAGIKPSVQAPPAKKVPLSNKVSNFVGLGGAVDVFSSHLARAGVGVQTEAEGKEFIEKPTGAQTAGAVAQVAAVPLGAALTGGASLAGRVAAGATVGYIYDVGTDLVDQKTPNEIGTPGIGTAVGASFPLALTGLSRLAGATAQGVRTGADNLDKIPGVVRKGSGSTAQKGPIDMGFGNVDPVTGETVFGGTTPGTKINNVFELGKEFAERVPRAARKFGVAVEDAGVRAERLKAATPAVRQAITSNLNDKLVNGIGKADDKTKAAMREVVRLSEATSDDLTPAQRPEIVSGDIVSDQYGRIDAGRQQVGSEIGALTRELSKTTQVPMEESYQVLDDILKQNGIIPAQTATGVKLQFTGKFTPAERSIIEKMYDLATEGGANISPRQVYDMDRLFSKMQRETRFGEVGDVIMDVEEGQISLFRAFRNVFSKELDKLSPEIKGLNSEYRELISLQGDLEKSIVKRGNFDVNRGESVAEFAQTNLRRIFSDATSAADYRLIYDKLDTMSRALGYNGPRADTIAQFTSMMRDVYPDSVPTGSFVSGIKKGVADLAGKVLDAGKPGAIDQQNALKRLLGDDIPGVVPKTTTEFKTQIVEGQWGVITAENPQGKAISVTENRKLNNALMQQLQDDGYELLPAKGTYGGNKENSFFVPEMTADDAIKYARMFDQESVLTPEGLVKPDGTLQRSDIKKVNFGEDQVDDFTSVQLDDGEVKFSMPIEDGPSVTTGTGEQNAEFFSGKAKEASSDVPYKPVIDTPQVQDQTKRAFDEFTMGGNFTGHIAKMIPAFAEKQMAVTDAIIRSNAKSFLDIGASEGGVAKTISSVNPKIKSIALDPNPQMRENFNLTRDVDNVEFKMEALGDDGWTEDFNGESVEIKPFKTTEKFDVINEDYAFQFINNDRKGQIAMVKEMLSDDGIFITSEKFHTANSAQNEVRKLDHQRNYFDESQLTEDKQTIISGMADDMVNDLEYEQLLSEEFDHVIEYWNSGDFKGYVASNNKKVIDKFIKDVGDVNSEFSEVQTPRVVKGGEDFKGGGKPQTTSPVEPSPEIVEIVEEINSIRGGDKPLGSEIFKRGDDFVSMSDVVARERFDIPNLKKVSFGGSDRDVYDIGDGNVLKIAKSARGLAQNAMADFYAADAGLIPDIKEIGRNYVVFEKVDAPDANVKAMVKELKKIGQPFQQPGDSQKYFRTINELQEKMEEFGYPGSSLADYGDDLLWGDFLAIRNWGTKNGQPIHIDEGSLSGRFVEEFNTKAQQGIKNLDDPEFREIYQLSKDIRKKFGDLDGKTMYGITGLLALTSGATATSN